MINKSSVVTSATPEAIQISPPYLLTSWLRCRLLGAVCKEGGLEKRILTSSAVGSTCRQIICQTVVTITKYHIALSKSFCSTLDEEKARMLSFSSQFKSAAGAIFLLPGLFLLTKSKTTSQGKDQLAYSKKH